MKIALSTNWCNRRMTSGEEIADTAVELGFDALELGFHTTSEQVAGFKSRLDTIPVGSVHAFAPVPISAPCGYPELYSLASFDEDERALARVHVKRNLAFAAEMGADTLVLHAGRVSFASFFRRRFDSVALRETLERHGKKTDAGAYRRLLAKARKTRTDRGAKLMELFRKELDLLVPELEATGVTLALENLPYLEGFPDESETKALFESYRDAPVRAWFDTGHDRVRVSHGWTDTGFAACPEMFAGVHVNDVHDLYDEHLPPGEGLVDFAALKPLLSSVAHVVIEPSHTVPAENLRRGVGFLRAALG